MVKNYVLFRRLKHKLKMRLISCLLNQIPHNRAPIQYKGDILPV